MEDYVDDPSKKAALQKAVLEKAAQIERKLTESIPSAADVKLAEVKAELISLLRENAPQRLKRHRHWVKKILISVLIMIVTVCAVIVHGSRDIG